MRWNYYLRCLRWQRKPNTFSKNFPGAFTMVTHLIGSYCIMLCKLCYTSLFQWCWSSFSLRILNTNLLQINLPDETSPVWIILNLPIRTRSAYSNRETLCRASFSHWAIWLCCQGQLSFVYQTKIIGLRRASDAESASVIRHYCSAKNTI